MLEHVGQRLLHDAEGGQVDARRQRTRRARPVQPHGEAGVAAAGRAAPGRRPGRAAGRGRRGASSAGAEQRRAGGAGRPAPARPQSCTDLRGGDGPVGVERDRCARRRRPAPTITPTECAITSCSSRAIRVRSAATAACACASRLRRSSSVVRASSSISSRRARSARPAAQAPASRPTPQMIEETPCERRDGEGGGCEHQPGDGLAELDRTREGRHDQQRGGDRGEVVVLAGPAQVERRGSCRRRRAAPSTGTAGATAAATPKSSTLGTVAQYGPPTWPMASSTAPEGDDARRPAPASTQDGRGVAAAWAHATTATAASRRPPAGRHAYCSGAHARLRGDTRRGRCGRHRREDAAGVPRFASVPVGRIRRSPPAKELHGPAPPSADPPLGRGARACRCSSSP